MYSAARGFAGQGIPEGAYTSTIYGLIRDRRFKEAINILSAELPSNPKSRAALSLLAYCYYNIGDFVSAAGRFRRPSPLSFPLPSFCCRVFFFFVAPTISARALAATRNSSSTTRT